jgi:enoyl-CoA hydratase
MTEKLRYELKDGIAHVQMDDGKANVMTKDMLEALLAAFDRAEADGAVLVLRGRERVFSGGYDLKMFSESPAVVVSTLRLGATLVARMADFPLPVLAVCTGHAVAQGAFTLLAADVRLGAEGPFKLGLNEVMIGLTIPHYGVEIARSRLQPTYFQHATITGAMYAPEEAVRAGFLDAIYPPEQLTERALEEAQRLRKLNMEAHAGTKRRVRAGVLKLIRQSIAQELVVPPASQAP